MTRAITLALALCCAPMAHAQGRDSVIVESDSTALHLLGVEMRSVEARRMALAARGSRAWMIFNEAGAAWSLSSDEASSRMETDGHEVWQPGFVPAASLVDSLTLALSFHEPQSEPPYLWVMPYDAELGTLLRVAGANAATWIPPEAVPWYALRDSTVYLTIPNWGPTLVFAIAWRLSNPAMGESVGPPLPQLTAGRVGSSPQIPLVARFDTSTTPDSSVVILRFDPFVWEEPCYREGGCE